MSTCVKKLMTMYLITKENNLLTSGSVLSQKMTKMSEIGSIIITTTKGITRVILAITIHC